MKREVEPGMNVADLEFVDPGTAAAQRWHARIAGSGLLRVAVIMVGILGVLAFVHGKIDTRARRARLLREAETDRVTHPLPARLIDLLDQATLDLAREPFAGPVSGPLDVTGEGLYLRAVQDEVRSSRAIHSATHASRKDSFVACLVEPPADLAHATIHKAATKYRWGVDLNAIAPRVFDADVLDSGMRVASRAWIDEVTATLDPTALRLLDHERAARTPKMLNSATARASTKFIAIVIDELPTGSPIAAGNALSEAVRESRLDDVMKVPHDVRAAVIDASTGKVLVRVRTRVDAADLKVPNAMADAEEIHGCQAALAVRSAAG